MISIFLSINLLAQDRLPNILNDFKSDILIGIEKNKKFRDYDFILIKYEDNYWYSNINYRLFAYKDNSVDFYQLVKKKKNDRIKIKRKITADYSDFVILIDSLVNKGLFQVSADDLNSEIVNSDGSITRLQISDGISEVFAIYSHGQSWGLEVYEPKRHYDFSSKESFRVVLESIDLINEYYRKTKANSQYRK